MARFLIGLALVVSAGASQIHPVEVSLDEVLQAARIVLVAEPADPPRRAVEDGVVHGSDCAYGVARFVVGELVHAPDGGVEKGATIEVADADFELYCAMQQAMAAGDPVPSPIIPEYRSGRQAPADGARILYLAPSGNGPLRYAISDAWDPLSELSDLRLRLAARE